MGSRRHRGIRRLMLGSVTEQAVRTVALRVLITNARAPTEEAADAIT
jgi:nucleotide-binding universal stress UspA family protein